MFGVGLQKLFDKHVVSAGNGGRGVGKACMCVDLESGIVASKLELEVGSMSLSSPPCLSAVFEDVSTGTGEIIPPLGI